MNDILQYKEYFATAHYSAADEVFYGKLVGINDVVSFEGTTVGELKMAFHDAVEDYLETCAELGKEPEKLYKGSFNIRIPSELHRMAAIQAALKDMSLNDFVRYAIDFTLKQSDGVRSLTALIFLITLIWPALTAGFFMLSRLYYCIA